MMETTSLVFTFTFTRRFFSNKRKNIIFFFHFETTIELARKNAAPKVMEEDLCNHDTRVKYGTLETHRN